jgi:hypothetical protein
MPALHLHHHSLQEHPLIMAKPDTPAKETKVRALRVSTQRGVQTFRRAGREFTPEPRELAIADLSREQLRALRDEPMLVCEEVELPARS